MKQTCFFCFATKPHSLAPSITQSSISHQELTLLRVSREKSMECERNRRGLEALRELWKNRVAASENF